MTFPKVLGAEQFFLKVIQSCICQVFWDMSFNLTPSSVYTNNIVKNSVKTIAFGLNYIRLNYMKLQFLWVKNGGMLPFFMVQPNKCPSLNLPLKLLNSEDYFCVSRAQQYVLLVAQ